VAINADAADQSVNGSIDVQAEAVKQVREPAETSAGCSVDSDANTTAAGERAPPGADADIDADDRDEPAARSGAAGFPVALVLGLATVVALGALGGWSGYGAYQAHQTDTLRNRFLAAGRQGALNLTTINYTEADADIQRILDSSTGQFHNDFSKRAPAFSDVVKQAQSKTEGSITEAGVESVTGDSAGVLVAVAVNTSNTGAANQPPRHWRMRIDVQKVGDTVKISNVGFVP
jgi:Mce-associated membrane protein